MILTILFCLFVLLTVCYAAALSRAAGMPLPGRNDLAVLVGPGETGDSEKVNESTRLRSLTCGMQTVGSGAPSPRQSPSVPHQGQTRTALEIPTTSRLALLLWIGGTCR
jgi:hypothetical protein